MNKTLASMVRVFAFALGLLTVSGFGRSTTRARDSVQIDRLFVSPNAFGSTIYVDGTNGNDDNTGLDPKSALQTITQAATNAAAWDIIIIAPGTYTVDVGSASLVPKAYQTWQAAQIVEGGAPTVIFTADADDNANEDVEIDVDGVVFRGIEFKLVAGGTTHLEVVTAAQTTAVRGLTFEDCWFNVNDVDAASAYVLNLDDATNAVTGLVLRRCRFTGGSATTNQSIYINVGVGGIVAPLIEDCIFELESADGDAKAMSFADPAASGKSYAGVLRNNDFIGPKDGGGDAVPIEFTAAMTEDEIVMMIRTNYFAECSATPITQDEVNGSLVNNYVGDNATGGTLVDPGS